MPVYFFSKLTPPRPSFAFEMNDSERALMQQHGAYWSEVAADGNAIVFGPVADPNGPFGLLVLEVETEAGGPTVDRERSGEPIRAQLQVRKLPDAQRSNAE